MSDSALIQELVDLRKQIHKLEEENRKLKAWVEFASGPSPKPSLDPVPDPPVDLPPATK